MKLLLLPTLLLTTATLVLANPIPEADPLASLPVLTIRNDCEACVTNYTHCYGACNGQQIMNGFVCARLCGVRGCKVEACAKCEEFAEKHCQNMPKEE